MLDVGGQDATEAFEDVSHSDEARETLEQLLVGTLKRQVRFSGFLSSSLFSLSLSPSALLSCGRCRLANACPSTARRPPAQGLAAGQPGGRQHQLGRHGLDAVRRRPRRWPRRLRCLPVHAEPAGRHRVRLGGPASANPPFDIPQAPPSPQCIEGGEQAPGMATDERCLVSRLDIYLDSGGCTDDRR